MMSRQTGLVSGFLIFILLPLALADAYAQPAGSRSYPARPIRIVIPFPPGGATDIMARTIAQKLSRNWGQQVVVDNRPGAGGSIAAELAARSAPDGYTLFLGGTAQLAVNSSLYKKLAYDPVKDFAPIILVGSSPNIAVANPSLPARSLKELIALAKARPGQLNYASPGSGSTAHLSAELLKLQTGIDIVHVPYKGAAPGVIDVLSGQVPLMFVSIPSVLGHVKMGKLIALGVTGAKRTPAAPDVPTFAETLPGFEASAWYGLLSAARTPQAIIDRLNREVASIHQGEDVKEIYAAQGIEIAGGSPAAFAAYIKSELEKWAVVVRKSGARSD
jgi:tripartite-type tricarboxylate transporter receptor subunit TctC